MRHKENRSTGRRTFRLRYKLFLTLTLGLLLSICLFFLIQSIGYRLIEKNYLDDESVAERLTYYENSLENYVRLNGISSKDTAMLSQWVKAESNIYLILYDGDEIIYESGWWDEESSKLSESEETGITVGISEVASEQEEDSGEGSGAEQAAEDSGGTAVENGAAEAEDLQSDEDTADSAVDENSLSTYDIEFSDGIYGASIIEFSEMRWYNLVDILAWSIFILTIFAVLLLYNRYITNRIIRLSKEVSVITSGEWESEIQHSGNDEISKLAEGVDDLRNTMAAHFEREKAAWKVNSELITSMSHDIRTPLTSLIGYLDILDGELNPSEDDCRKYVSSCRQKALQLKDLSDKMFQYFLVFGSDSIEMDVQLYDTDILLQQIFAEQIFHLKNAGFSIKTDFTKGTGKIEADVQYMNRLFDNLFSNVKKYAVPESTVVLRTRMLGAEILFTIGNEIRRDGALVESTNIGLKTCRKIVEQMKGRFRIDRTEDYFEVNIVLPIKPEEEKISKNLQLGGV